MEKKKNCVKDIYVWLDGGRQKACSVKCETKDVEKLLNQLETEFSKMFTYGESYKMFYGDASLEKAVKHCRAKIKRILKKVEEA